MNDNRTEIIELLRSTNRPGIEDVIVWLDTAPSFFEASGARIHHDNVVGGLASHSLKVYEHARADWESRDDAFKTKYPLESIIISALLHDVCKKDVYYIDADGIPQWNEENHRKGHGLRSVRLLEELGLSLTPDERMAIWWHMGAGNEMSQPDYPQEYAIAMQDPFCQLIHEADHMAAKQSDKETKEARFESLKWDAKRTLFRLKNGGGRFIFGAVRSEVYKHNLEIFKAWKFETPSGKMIDLIGSRQQLLDATKVYREAVSASEIPPRYATTRTGCANEDCLVVAKQLIDLGLNPAVLNLADAYHACGMYNSGSGAQEESLCLPLVPTLWTSILVASTHPALPCSVTIKILVLPFVKNPIRHPSSLWLRSTSVLGTRPTIWNIVPMMEALPRKVNKSCMTRFERSIVSPCSMAMIPSFWAHSDVACSNLNPNSLPNTSNRCSMRTSSVASSTLLSLRCWRVRTHLVRRLRKRATLLLSTSNSEDFNVINNQK